MKILVAEDNPVNQMVTQSFLKALGYGSDLAADGFEAVSRLNETEYDIVFMDIEMPGLGGCEASKRIREAECTQPHIIAMSAHDESEIVSRLSESGMDDYIAKPVSKRSLEEALSRYQAKQTQSNPLA